MHKTVVFCKHDLKIQTIDALTLRGHEASWVTSSKEARLKEKAFLVAAKRKKSTACTKLQKVSVYFISAYKELEEMYCLSHVPEHCILCRWTTGGDDADKQAKHYSFQVVCTNGKREKVFCEYKEAKLQWTHCLTEHIGPKILLYKVCIYSKTYKFYLYNSIFMFPFLQGIQ